MEKSHYTYRTDFYDCDDVRNPVVRTNQPAPPTAAAGSSPAGTAAQKTARRAGVPLDKQAVIMIRSLPNGAKPEFTEANFPHLLNRLAANWHNPRALRQFVDDLVIDQRGGRAGMPFKALSELGIVCDWRLEQLTGRRGG